MARSKIADVIEDFLGLNAKVYHKSGLIISGKLWAASEYSEYDYYNDGVSLNTYWVGCIKEIEFAKIPDGVSVFEQNGCSTIKSDKHIFSEGLEGYYSEENEPEKIVINEPESIYNNTMIWDLQKNCCLRYEWQNKRTYEEKIR